VGQQTCHVYVIFNILVAVRVFFNVCVLTNYTEY